MNALFARAARQLSGVTVLLLGWKLDEFWRSTPDELAAIFEHLESERPDAMTPGDLGRLREMHPDG